MDNNIEINENINQLNNIIKKKRISKILFLIFVILFILGSGIFVFLKQKGTLNRPEKVFLKMDEKMKNIETLSMNIRINSNTKQPLKDTILERKKNIEYSFKIDKKNNEIEGDLQIDSGGSPHKIKEKILSDGVYIKLEAKDYALFSSPLFESLRDKWIKISKDTYGKLKGITYGLTSTTFDLPETEGLTFDPINLEEIFKEDIKSSASLYRYLEFFQNPNNYLIIKELGNEKINNKICNHYKVVINKKELVRTLRNLSFEETSNYIDLNDALENFINNKKDMEGDIWINQSDNFLSAVSFQINPDHIKYGNVKERIPGYNYGILPIGVSEFERFTSTIIGGLRDKINIEGSYNFVINFTNFNDVLKIEIPQEAVNLNNFLDDFKDLYLKRDFKSLYLKRADSYLEIGDAGQEPKTISENNIEKERKFYETKLIQSALESFFTDHNKYPSAEKNVNLGKNDYVCLSSNGFSKSDLCSDYSNIILKEIPFDKESGKNYIYNLFSPNFYTIEFEQSEDTTNFLRGKYIASPIGIFSFGKDTDGDGYSDGEEIKNGYCPFKANIKLKDNNCHQ